jgi:hypothetical protein
MNVPIKWFVITGIPGLWKFLMASVITGSVILLPSAAHAHCTWSHPHHCVENVFDDVVDFIYGGIKKRAKMIYNDPLGAILDPIKVIDESIPSPMSYVEYVVKNPDEIIEVLKNPVAGVVGMPLAMAIADGRNSALRNGTKPIPQDVRSKLELYFDDKLLNSVRYSSNQGLFNGLLQGIALHGSSAVAITLVNVVVFEDAARAYDIDVWAHELRHVKQYHDLGLTEFAATYTLDFHAIEDPAYHFNNYFQFVRSSNMVSSEHFIGLGGKCLTRSSNSINATVYLDACVPTRALQRWSYHRNREIHVPGSTMCLEVRNGDRDNRTQVRISPCNNESKQSFAFTRRGELKSAVRENYCVEVVGGMTADNTPIQMFDCNKTASQIWINPTLKLIAHSATSVSRRCLRADALTLSAMVSLSDCRREDPLQLWASEGYGGKIRLIQLPDACLQVRNLSSAPGTRLQIARCSELDDQGFESTMRQEIRTDVSRNMCIGVSEAGEVVTASCNNSPSQLWN